MPHYPAKRELLADKRSYNNNNNNNNEDVAVLSHIFIPIHLRLSSMCYNLLLYGIKVALFNK